MVLHLRKLLHNHYSNYQNQHINYYIGKNFQGYSLHIHILRMSHHHFHHNHYYYYNQNHRNQYTHLHHHLYHYYSLQLLECHHHVGGFPDNSKSHLGKRSIHKWLNLKIHPTHFHLLHYYF